MKIRNPNLQKIIASQINEWFIKEKTKLERKKSRDSPNKKKEILMRRLSFMLLILAKFLPVGWVVILFIYGQV